MAYKVTILSVTPDDEGGFKVVFSNDDDTGIQYETWAGSGGSFAVTSAIKKMCDQRKAVGSYTPAET